MLGVERIIRRTFRKVERKNFGENPVNVKICPNVKIVKSVQKLSKHGKNFVGSFQRRILLESFNSL